MDLFMTSWLPNILSFLAGSVVTTVVAILIYRRQRRDAASGVVMLTEVHRKMQSGTMTTDQAAKEIIRGLETGALNPDALQAWECKSAVGVVVSWSADEHNAFGGRKCKNPQCTWSKEFSY